MTVGDVTSAARGSGARLNSNKPEWHQIPCWALSGARQVFAGLSLNSPDKITLYQVIDKLDSWQRGSNEALDVAIAQLVIVRARGLGLKLQNFPFMALDGVARVLMYGAKKYSAYEDDRLIKSGKGNWARGMAWSICFDSCRRHLHKTLAGQELDDESGEHHLDHALCNLLFLSAYRDLFPEGDDRLQEFRPGGVKVLPPASEVLVGGPPCVPAITPFKIFPEGAPGSPLPEIKGGRVSPERNDADFQKRVGGYYHPKTRKDDQG